MHEPGGWPEAAGGLIGCLGAVAAWATSQGLAAVDPTVVGRGVTIPTTPLSTSWIVVVAATAASLVASGGRPAGRGSRRAGVAAVPQVVAGLALAVVVPGGVALMNAFWFTGPGDSCASAGCWPLRADLALRCAPALLTAVALVAAATLRRRLPWVARAVAPAALYLVLVIAQRLAWDPVVVPWFHSHAR